MVSQNCVHEGTILSLQISKWAPKISMNIINAVFSLGPRQNYQFVEVILCHFSRFFWRILFILVFNHLFIQLFFIESLLGGRHNCQCYRHSRAKDSQPPCVYGAYILETKVESDYKKRVNKKETLGNKTCNDKNEIEWHAGDHLGPPKIWSSGKASLKSWELWANRAKMLGSSVANRRSLVNAKPQGHATETTSNPGVWWTGRRVTEVQ